jgi:hypothetical protein
MAEPRSDMSSEDATTLYYLRRIWEGSYTIDRNSDGVWHASRVTGGASLMSADTALELRELIIEDYSSWIRDTSRPRQ